MAQAKYLLLMKLNGTRSSQELCTKRDQVEMITIEARDILIQEPEGSEARTLALTSPFFEKLRRAKHVLSGRKPNNNNP